MHYRINRFQCRKIDVKVENAKRRITVLLIVNALGEKKFLVIIGNSEKPKCFKNI